MLVLVLVVLVRVLRLELHGTEVGICGLRGKSEWIDGRVRGQAAKSGGWRAWWTYEGEHGRWIHQRADGRRIRAKHYELRSADSQA